VETTKLHLYDTTMFSGKKKKRIDISEPSNFEHRVHTGFNEDEGKFTGLPLQWQSIIPDSKARPRPLIDASHITPVPTEKVSILLLMFFYETFSKFLQNR